MSTVSERIPILVTKQEKARIAKRASEAGLSVGAFARQALARYEPDKDDAVLERLLVQLSAATDRAERAVDASLEFAAASNLRIEVMEASHRSRQSKRERGRGAQNEGPAE